ncbi:hypothetical protein O181_126263 [Austropuccinia psidii MF-1]|uniref:Uncharacterized protein n=1 Tax=Austropuccinia psidii MF-1 TaxID=1389203 RepID=A0A9Q3Q5U4_9BASI|nr:hypothetical protein [Austropuccinia psidii MF-1]
MTFHLILFYKSLLSFSKYHQALFTYSSIIPVQHSPPAKNTRSQRNQTVLTPTARAPLDHTPSGDQMSASLDRGLLMEGQAPSKIGGMKSRR